MRCLYLRKDGTDSVMLFVALTAADLDQLQRDGGLPNGETGARFNVEGVVFRLFPTDEDADRFFKHIVAGGRVKDFVMSDGKRFQG